MKPHIRPCRLQYISGMGFFTAAATHCVRYSCEARGVRRYGATPQDAYRHWAKDAKPWWERWFA